MSMDIIVSIIRDKSIFANSVHLLKEDILDLQYYNYEASRNY
jgi:hypothetical protein